MIYNCRINRKNAFFTANLMIRQLSRDSFILPKIPRLSEIYPAGKNCPFTVMLKFRIFPLAGFCWRFYETVFQISAADYCHRICPDGFLCSTDAESHNKQRNANVFSAGK